MQKKKKKNTESIDPKVSATNYGRIMILSKCAIRDSKKSKFIKKQEAKGLLSNLGIRTPLSEIPSLGDVLFKLKLYKMNNVINKLLLTADKFTPETYLKDLKVGTFSACGPFTRHKNRIKKFIQTGDTNYIYNNELDKACFAHDAAYSDFKDIKNRTAADKTLRDKGYKIANDPKYYGSQRGLASMVYNFFDKKTASSGVKSIPQN